MPSSSPLSNITKFWGTKLTIVDINASNHAIDLKFDRIPTTRTRSDTVVSGQNNYQAPY